MAPDAKLAVRFPLSLARVECRQYSELVSTCHPLTGQVSSTHSAGVRQSSGIGCFSQSFVRPALAVKFRVRCFTGPSGQHSALEMAVGLTRTRSWFLPICSRSGSQTIVHTRSHTHAPREAEKRERQRAT